MAVDLRIELLGRSFLTLRDFTAGHPQWMLERSVYDTLDVCTRLGRYIVQELTGLKGRAGAWLGTGASGASRSARSRE